MVKLYGDARVLLSLISVLQTIVCMSIIYQSAGRYGSVLANSSEGGGASGSLRSLELGCTHREVNKKGEGRPPL